MNFKFIDLFSGIGGFRIGFEREFSKCVLSVENDKYARKVYQDNFNMVPYMDIRDLSYKKIPKYDILLAGVPCQPFSRAGKKEGFKNESLGDLFDKTLEIIYSTKPKCFVIENVTGMLDKYKGIKQTNAEIIMDSLNNLDYHTYLKIFNSKDFGVPQNRKRLFFIGFKKNINTARNIDFSIPKIKKTFINEILEQNMDGYEISNKLQYNYLYKNDSYPQVVDSSSKIIVKPLVSSYYKVQRLTGTFVKDGSTGLRLFSRKEALRLMGFPEDFILNISRTQTYMKLGNSVVIPVIEFIADKIYDILKKDALSNNYL